MRFLLKMSLQRIFFEISSVMTMKRKDWRTNQGREIKMNSVFAVNEGKNAGPSAAVAN